MKASGVLVLQGRCGNTISVHQEAVAPCRMPYLDGTVDPRLARPHANLGCEVCNHPDAEEVMLCDSCGSAWHLYCCTPPLDTIPDGNYICWNCAAAGITHADLEQRQVILAHQAPTKDQRDTLFKPLACRLRDETAQSYEGRIVCKKTSTRKGNITDLWGVVHFRGKEFRPRYFELVYDDGSTEIATGTIPKKMQMLPASAPHPRSIADDPVELITANRGRGRPCKNLTFTKP